MAVVVSNASRVDQPNTALYSTVSPMHSSLWVVRCTYQAADYVALTGISLLGVPAFIGAGQIAWAFACGTFNASNVAYAGWGRFDPTLSNARWTPSANLDYSTITNNDYMIILVGAV